MKYQQYLIGALSVVLIMAGYEMMSPFWETSKQSCTLETARTTNASKAAYCGELLPEPITCEEIRVPMRIEKECEITECDCSVDYTQGFTEGVLEGWMTIDTVSEIKTPERTVKHARNYRDSKDNLPDYTQAR